MVAGAAIGVAADEIDVHRLEIGRRIGAPRDDVLAEAVDVAREDRLDAIGIGLADRLAPAPVAPARRSRPPRRP